jgi:dynein heavy chain
MSKPDFLNVLLGVEKDHISNKTLLKLQKYTSDPKMTFTNIAKISEAALAIWKWVTAVEKYAKAFKDIEPKKNKVNILTERY